MRKTRCNTTKKARFSLVAVDDCTVLPFPARFCLLDWCGRGNGIKEKQIQCMATEGFSMSKTVCFSFFFIF